MTEVDLAQGANDAHPLAGRGRIALVLGSGAAKGWAHIGVIRALEARGVRPSIICGASMGGLVGAAYAADRLDDFEAWAGALEWRRVVSYVDLATRGGLLKASSFFEFFEPDFEETLIEDLPRPFAAVGTDLSTGQEIWLREGGLIEALRSTIALPGLVTPSRWEGRWLVDGGLVNPVPVSLARAMGADFVIAVDLNTTLLGRRLRPDGPETAGAARPVPIEERASGQAAAILAAERKLLEESDDGVEEAEAASKLALADRMSVAFRELAGEVRDRFSSDAPAAPDMPSLYDVLANSINIMQMRIGRSRMAGDPPEMLITPRLEDFGLLDFDRSAEAIEEGKRALESAWTANFAPS